MLRLQAFRLSTGIHALLLSRIIRQESLIVNLTTNDRMVVAQRFESVIQSGFVCHSLRASDKAVLHGDAHQVSECLICRTSVESEVSAMQLGEGFL